jgi:hypothetical protein
VEDDSAEKVIFISIMLTVLFVHLELIDKDRVKSETRWMLISSTAPLSWNETSGNLRNLRNLRNFGSLSTCTSPHMTTLISSSEMRQ